MSDGTSKKDTVDLDALVTKEAQALTLDSAALRSEVERELIARAARRIADKVEKGQKPKSFATF